MNNLAESQGILVSESRQLVLVWIFDLKSFLIPVSLLQIKASQFLFSNEVEKVLIKSLVLIKTIYQL